MLIKGTKHIENLSTAKCIAFDKTGTVTTGKMQIDTINTKANFSEEEILKYMYTVEKNSNHPISTDIKQKVENLKLNVDYTVENYEEIAGYGIKAIINNKEILFGNTKLLEKYNIKIENYNEKANYLEAIPKSIKIARKSMRIIKENIVFSLIAKAIVLTLGIMGIAPVWLAVIADTGVSLLTVLNSLRIFK